MDYETFIRSKRVAAKPSGFDVERSKLNANLFPFQRDIVRWALRLGKAAIWAERGLGKGQPNDSVVLTPDGWQTIGSLSEGDRVIGRDGKACRVTGVFPKGPIKCYRVYFCDGTSVVCDKEHLWCVRGHNDKHRNKPWRVMGVEEIIASGIASERPGVRNRKWCIPMVDPVEFPEKEHVIHPYVMGVLLGDGSVSGNTVTWTKPDIEVAEKVASLVPCGVHIAARESFGERCPVWSVRSDVVGHGYSNAVVDELRLLGLMGCRSHEKFVPERYLFSSVQQRIDLLQGLMDTDGYAGETPEFCSTSRNLAEAVVFLVQSLGGKAVLSVKKSPVYRHNGEVRIGREAYRVTMTMPEGFNPFSLPRKADKFKPPTRYMDRWIDRIEEVGEMPTTCISVDAEDHLYVTNDFIVTHNTVQQLEWGCNVYRRTGGKLLLFTPLAVAEQTQREAAKFRVECPVKIVREQSDCEPGINITNYEKLDKFDPAAFEGLILDESSILKGMNTATKTALLTDWTCVPYRLACSATPAPNDHMELGNHAEFLGVMTRSEMLSMFFTHDGGDTSKWRLRGHAASEFWRFLASWAVMLRRPSDLGYDDAGFDLPPLTYHEHIIETTAVQPGRLFAVEASTLRERQVARKESLSARVGRTAELVASSPGPWLIWCDLNDESTALARAIPGAVEVAGRHTEEQKRAAMEGFSTGSIRVLVTKPSIAGWGMNWQHCSQMAFVGLSDSFEQVYQAIGRCYRFGQTWPVAVHFVIGEREGAVLQNIRRKQADAERMAAEMVKFMHVVNEENLKGTMRQETEYKPQVRMTLPSFLGVGA